MWPLLRPVPVGNVAANGRAGRGDEHGQTRFPGRRGGCCNPAQNDLEEDFIAAFNTPSRRLAFRHAMVLNPLTLALDAAGDNARPLMVEVMLRTGAFRGVAVFTSPARLVSVLGEHAPSTTEPGRDILERLRGHNVVLNYRLIPVLTLDASDVADYLANTPASAGPAQ
jgi:hypothetical protein